LRTPSPMALKKSWYRSDMATGRSSARCSPDRRAPGTSRTRSSRCRPAGRSRRRRRPCPPPRPRWPPRRSAARRRSTCTPSSLAPFAAAEGVVLGVFLAYFAGARRPSRGRCSPAARRAGCAGTSSHGRASSGPTCGGKEIRLLRQVNLLDANRPCLGTTSPSSLSKNQRQPSSSSRCMLRGRWSRLFPGEEQVAILHEDSVAIARHRLRWAREPQIEGERPNDDRGLAGGWPLPLRNRLILDLRSGNLLDVLRDLLRRVAFGQRPAPLLRIRTRGLPSHHSTATGAPSRTISTAWRRCPR